MRSKTLQVWFDFASTYSYPAIMRIGELIQKNNIHLEWRPFLLGPFFQSQGWNDSPFNIYLAKGKYMWRDLERVCELYQLPLKKPSQFPRNGVLAARIACVNQSESWSAEFIKKVFKANFVQDLDISQKEVINEILKSLNQPASEIIEKSLSKENKNKLREQTEEAVKLGVFGAPTFVVEEELFWGNDRLEMAIKYYNKNSPSLR